MSEERLYIIMVVIIVIGKNDIPQFELDISYTNSTDAFFILNMHIQ